MNTFGKRQMKMGAGIALSFALAAALSGCNNKGGGTSSGPGVLPSGSGSDTIATVNGEPISRDQVRSITETTSGPQTLATLINLRLIEQAMKKDNITVPDAEIQKAYDDAVAKQLSQEAQQSGQNSFKLLIASAEGKSLVRRQTAAQLGVDYLVTKDIKTDDAKLKAWFDKHKAEYGSPAELKVGILGASTKVRADALEQQLKSKSKTFPQLVEEQKKANDPAAQQLSNEGLDVPEAALQGKTNDPLATAIMKTKEGEISAPIKIGKAPQEAFAIITVLSRTPAKVPDLSTMRSQIEQDYKLEQVAREDLKTNFDAAVKQVQQGMAQQAMQRPGTPAPKYHDVLEMLAQSAKAKLLERLRTEGKVDVSDKLYASIADQFKPTPAAPAGTDGAPASGAPAAGAPAPAAPAGNAVP